MNVRHNDDDRPNSAGAATVAERRSSHDASHREWRWITAGQSALQKMDGLNKLFLGDRGILKIRKVFSLALGRAEYFLEGRNLPLLWKYIKSNALGTLLNLM